MKRIAVLTLTLVFTLTGTLFADDTDIYDGVSVSVAPNVLIIFDTSGSMGTDDVPVTYDPDETYSGDYDSDGVYYKTTTSSSSGRGHGHSGGGGENWELYTDSIDDLDGVCNDVAAELEEKGYTSSSSTCDTTTSYFRLGNYLNYLENYDSDSDGTTTRLAAAKIAVTEIIETAENVNLGLMRFNGSKGGKLVVDCDRGTATEEEHKQDLLDAVDAFTASDYTPLAETLAEAGLYFAGNSSYFNSGVSYTSPIQYSCQKNYIILMTDGNSTQDQDTILSTSGAYIDGDTIGDYDGDGVDSTAYSNSGSDYLDDVAMYLYEKDLSSTLDDTQNIQTFTIGFNLDGINEELLMETAMHGNGITIAGTDQDGDGDSDLEDLREESEGYYFVASSSSGLVEAFEMIISSLEESSAVFVAPVVPVSRMNKTYAGDRIYLGFFKPTLDGRWYGNLKKYGLDQDTGDMYDYNGADVLDDDGIIQDVKSFWSNLNDGNSVVDGGVGSLMDNSGRTIYTYTGEEDGELTSFENTSDFTDAINTEDTPGGPYEFSDPDTLIPDIRGENAPDPAISDARSGEDEWILGDVIHSAPAVVHYSDATISTLTQEEDCSINESYIFSGSNDGMMHAFRDCDGEEAWAFIPPRQLGNLENITGDTVHDYFVDGSPVVYSYDHDDDGGLSTPDKRILFFGERRGGNYYNALDITDPTAPLWLYEVGPARTAYGTLADQLGQSWIKPSYYTIMNGETAEIVFLMTGGYDTNQDLDVTDEDEVCPSDTDSTGRAVYTILTTTGALSSLNFHNDGTNNTDMTHGIVDASGFDVTGDGVTTRVYAGDLGGNMFAFTDDMTVDSTNYVQSKTADGTWTKIHLFQASDEEYSCTYSGTTSTVNLKKKIFYSPDAVSELFYNELERTGATTEEVIQTGEYLFFGTGDRSHPKEKEVVNRIYAIKNKWDDKIMKEGPLTESDLTDVTDNIIQEGTLDEQYAAQTALDASYGWYIQLNENEGEKVVSSPVVYGGVVYITTYTPASDTTTSTSTDPCVAGESSRGTGRLYAVNYLNGGAVYDDFSDEVEYRTDSDGNYINEDGEIVSQADAAVTLTSGDRSLVIGDSIPSAPVIAVLEGKSVLFVGIEGGVKTIDAVTTTSMNNYYWRPIVQ